MSNISIYIYIGFIFIVKMHMNNCDDKHSFLNFIILYYNMYILSYVYHHIYVYTLFMSINVKYIYIHIYIGFIYIVNMHMNNCDDEYSFLNFVILYYNMYILSFVYHYMYYMYMYILYSRV
jgi:hypothetical protein